jgi:hypothetical protein
MKKIIFIAAICLISISGFGQRTSEDVKNQILSTIGPNLVKFTPELNYLFVQFNKLQARELRMLPLKDKLTYSPNLNVDVCFVCICPNCGCTVLQGNGNCGMRPGSCGVCPCCGWGMQSYVMSCLGGMCGNIQG